MVQSVPEFMEEGEYFVVRKACGLTVDWGREIADQISDRRLKLAIRGAPAAAWMDDARGRCACLRARINPNKTERSVGRSGFPSGKSARRDARRAHHRREW